MSRRFWIGGLGLVTLLVLLVWGVIAGVGLVTDRLPQWLASGKQIVAQPVQKAEAVALRPAVTFGMGGHPTAAAPKHDDLRVVNLSETALYFPAARDFGIAGRGLLLSGSTLGKECS